MKTYERCYICDMSGMAETPESALSSSLVGETGARTVSIQPDGKPVCSMCMRVAMKSKYELETVHDEAVDWKAEDLAWLFDEDRDTVVHKPITPDGARAELERQQSQWRWEDLGWTEEQPPEAPDLTVQSDLE